MKEYLEVELARAYITKAQSCKDRNIEFNLSFSDFKKLFNRKTCFYTGVKIFHTRGVKNDSWTIDRIDASKGYVRGNVVACSQNINRKKKDLTVREIENLFVKIKSLNIVGG